MNSKIIVRVTDFIRNTQLDFHSSLEEHDINKMISGNEIFIKFLDNENLCYSFKKDSNSYERFVLRLGYSNRIEVINAVPLDNNLLSKLVDLLKDQILPEDLTNKITDIYNSIDLKEYAKNGNSVINKSIIGNIKRVVKRLELVHILEDQYPNIRKYDKEHGPDYTVSHPWGYIESLQIYLLLTCFDIIGTNKSFQPFGNWVNSKEFVNNNELFRDVSQDTFVRVLKTIVSTYNSIYGVNQSFKRFLNEYISIETKKRLLGSIEIREVEFKFTGDPIGSGGNSKKFDQEKKKLEFLFGLRNKFTHEGNIFMSGIKAIFHDFEEIKLQTRKQLGYDKYRALQPIQSDKKGQKRIEYFIDEKLVNILEDVVKEGLTNFIISS